MPIAYNPSTIDFSPLGDIGQNIGQGIQKRRLGKALEGVDPGDYNAMVKAIMGVNPYLGVKMAQQGGSSGPRPLSAPQYKALYEAETKLPGLENSISTLTRALELNPKTIDGWLASERANIGARGPEWLSSIAGIDKDAAMATEEWSRLMTPEAIQQMSASFKGSTTEKELMTMLQQIADPATPKQVRQKITERMLGLMNKEADVYRGRVQSLKPMEGGGLEGAGSQSTNEDLTPGMEVDGYIYRGGDPNDQNSWEASQ